MKYINALTAILLVLLTLIACKKDNKVKVACDGSSPTYESFVKDIVNTNCVSCHSEYSTYTGLSLITTNGDFEKAVLIDQNMPENGSICQDVMNKLQCWVNNGYPEN